MVRLIVFAYAATMCSGIASAQAVPTGVVKLAARTLVSKKFGTGICLDTPCLHVLTSYHVAALLGSRLKVEGVGVASVVAATGPEDDGSIELRVADSVVKFNPARDIALLTLRWPLPAGFAGVPFADYKPPVGQEVTRVAYHDNTIDNTRGKVVSAELLFQTSGAIVDLIGSFLVDCASRPGNSGGAVLDADGRMLGMVEMRSQEESGRSGTAVLGTPIITEFLRDADPILLAQLFDKNKSRAHVPASSLDWPIMLDHPPVAGNVSADQRVFVDVLKAQVARSIAQMQRMTAQQSMRFWGDDQPEQTWQYQVALYSDGQRFSTAGGKELLSKSLPAPSVGILPESEWYDVLSGIGSVRLRYTGSSSHKGTPVHVFVFQNTASDAVCQFRHRTPRIFGRKKDEVTFVDCDGVVVTDEYFRVLGITHRMLPQLGVVGEWQAVARYAPADFSSREEMHLVPLSMDLTARCKDGRMYYASEHWSDYHLFRAKSSLRTE